MRIFLSHSSHYKPMLRELRAKLPEHINAWIDEDRLLVGDNLSNSLQNAITKETDFVVLFVDEQAMQSPWVKREVEWALGVEQSIGRTFVLPIVLDSQAWERFEPAEFKKRKYISCRDFTQNGIEALAQNLSGQLFAWLSRDLENARLVPEPEEDNDILDDADRFLRTVASEVRTIVYPYRQQNPIPVDALLERMRSLDQVARFSRDQLTTLLTRLQRNSLLTGIYFDGDELFTEEQPYFWKIEAFTEAKRRISRTAFRMIRSGSVIALDGGSTTTAIAQRIGRGLVSRRLSNITVVTNSIPAAAELVGAANEMGIENDQSGFKVLLAGGRIRPNTQAVVAVDGDPGSAIHQLIKSVGRVDLSFIGTTGITEQGLTTGTEEEMMTKRAFLVPEAKHFIVTDPSKFDLELRYTFAPLDGLGIITIKDGYESILQKYEPIMASKGASLIYA